MPFSEPVPAHSSDLGSAVRSARTHTTGAHAWPRHRELITAEYMPAYARPLSLRQQDEYAYCAR